MMGLDEEKPSYAALWCKSNYSFLEGASHPEELVDRAVELGIKALALTDRDGVYGVVRAYTYARNKPLKLIFGAQLTLEDQTTITLLARNYLGWKNLCQIITLGHARAPKKGESRVRLAELCERAQGLIALWGGAQSLLASERPEAEVDAAARALKAAFSARIYALIARHDHEAQLEEEARTRQRAARHGLALVAAQEVLYHAPSRQRLQDVLTCVRHNITLSEAGRRLKANHTHGLASPRAFYRRFKDLPEAIARGEEIARSCTFSLAELRYIYPAQGLPAGVTPDDELRRLSYLGARSRYGEVLPKDAHQQLEHELAVVARLGYAGYFLSMAEIVEFCRAREILCQGRGSAANSVLCYCLGITAVDPVRMRLLFERFMSEERAEPPDIDLDIAHERREEVIQHVYARYGRAHAALLANMVRFRARSALRSVGEVLQVDPGALDRLSKLVGRSRPPTPEQLVDLGLDPDTPTHQLWLELSAELMEFPRHLSIHPGGFLLGHEPVHEMVPIEPATMQARTVVQWDKYDVEGLQLFKLDLLGLGALTHLDKAFRLIRAYRGEALSMATLPQDDPETYAMLQKGDAIGVFQVESRAQMAMAPRLKPRKFYDLVVQISLVRPGPISGDMVHPYLRRRNGQEPVDYPHPSLKPVLEKTLGVPLFQEQVMKLAVVAAGYTPGEADQLRRDMGAWRSDGRIEAHRDKLIRRMIAHGISADYAQRIFEQIRGFAEYGFPESHAASFALITYATAYLKCHFPAEFTCALLNSQPMGFYSPATIIEDARRRGVRFLAIDALHSAWDCRLEREDKKSVSLDRYAIRVGFRYLKGIKRSAWHHLKEVRIGFLSGARSDFRRFLQHLYAKIDARTLRKMARAGAFEGFGLSRRDALWAVRGLRRETLSLFDYRPAGSAQIGADFSGDEQPVFKPLGPDDEVLWDYQTTFHSVRGHPMAALRAELRRREIPAAAELNQFRHGQSVNYVGMVICRQRPATASGVIFMTLEDESGLANAVIWPSVDERYRVLVRTQTVLGISGRLQIQEGVTHLIAERVWAPELGWRAETPKSRDFR